MSTKNLLLGDYRNILYLKQQHYWIIHWINGIYINILWYSEENHIFIQIVMWDAYEGCAVRLTVCSFCFSFPVCAPVVAAATERTLVSGHRRPLCPGRCLLSLSTPVRSISVFCNLERQQVPTRPQLQKHVSFHPAALSQSDRSKYTGQESTANRASSVKEWASYCHLNFQKNHNSPTKY